MIKYYIFLILSAIFERIVYTYTFNTIFIPFFSIVALVMIYPCFKNDKSFFKTVIIFGFFHDLLFNHLLFSSLVLYIGVGIIAKLLHKKGNNGFFSKLLTGILAILFYKALTYLLHVFIISGNLSLVEFIKEILNSMLLNIIFMIFTYIIVVKKYRPLKNFR